MISCSGRFWNLIREWKYQRHGNSAATFNHPIFIRQMVKLSRLAKLTHAK